MYSNTIYAQNFASGLRLPAFPQLEEKKKKDNSFCKLKNVKMMTMWHLSQEAEEPLELVTL